MRSFALAIVLALCACDDGKAACIHDGASHALGDVFPAGDGCNSCTCTTSGVACTDVACGDAGVDANPAACGPSNGCPAGPACGVQCCGHGEQCVSGQCRCGARPGCRAGDLCARPGPVGADQCGTVCCGASGPCPL